LLLFSPHLPRSLSSTIGAPLQRYGMEITAVYLQPITMEPEGIMKSPAESDIHLEADIQALANNPNGYAEGAWIPYLKVQFELKKEGPADTDQRRADAHGSQRRGTLR